MAVQIPQGLVVQIANLNALPLEPAHRAQVVNFITQLAQLTLANNQANQQAIQQLTAQVQQLTQQLNLAQNNYNAQVAANASLVAANAGLIQVNQGYAQANGQLAAQGSQQAVNLANLTNAINSKANEILAAQREIQRLKGQRQDEITFVIDAWNEEIKSCEKIKADLRRGHPGYWLVSVMMLGTPILANDWEIRVRSCAINRFRELVGNETKTVQCAKEEAYNYALERTPSVR